MSEGEYRAEALRYRWLRERLLSVDFKYNAGNDTEEAVLIFELPNGTAVSSDLDDTIDRAMWVKP